MSDVRLNQPLLAACKRHVTAEDAICGGLAPGGGRVVECLKSRISVLDAPCAEQVTPQYAARGRRPHSSGRPARAVLDGSDV